MAEEPRQVIATRETYGGWSAPGAMHRLYPEGKVFPTTIPQKDLPEHIQPYGGVPEATDEVGEFGAPQTLAAAANPDYRVETALNRLDPADDQHWTENGLPAMVVVNELAGPGEPLTRADVHTFDPSFRRPEQG